MWDYFHLCPMLKNVIATVLMKKFVCVSDATLHHSVSADCVLTIDFTSSSTGLKSPDDTDIMSRDQSTEAVVWDDINESVSCYH